MSSQGLSSKIFTNGWVILLHEHPSFLKTFIQSAILEVEVHVMRYLKCFETVFDLPNLCCFNGTLSCFNFSQWRVYNFKGFQDFSSSFQLFRQANWSQLYKGNIFIKCCWVEIRTFCVDCKLYHQFPFIVRIFFSHFDIWIQWHSFVEWSLDTFKNAFFTSLFCV